MTHSKRREAVNLSTRQDTCLLFDNDICFPRPWSGGCTVISSMHKLFRVRSILWGHSLIQPTEGLEWWVIAQIRKGDVTLKKVLWDCCRLYVCTNLFTYMLGETFTEIQTSGRKLAYKHTIAFNETVLLCFIILISSKWNDLIRKQASFQKPRGEVSERLLRGFCRQNEFLVSFWNITLIMKSVSFLIYLHKDLQKNSAL